VDTETTGLEEDARIVELAWALTDESFDVIHRHSMLIRPHLSLRPDTELEPHSDDSALQYEFVHGGEASRINGITQEDLIRDGQDMNDVLTIFLESMNMGATHFIAHNVRFDHRTIVYECKKHERQDVLDRFAQLHPICSMKSTTKIVNLPKYKWPRLMELYTFCYGEGTALPGQGTAHRADTDVETLRMCLVHLQTEHGMTMNENNQLTFP